MEYTWSLIVLFKVWHVQLPTFSSASLGGKIIMNQTTIMNDHYQLVLLYFMAHV